jgi:hypothetical protein
MSLPPQLVFPGRGHLSSMLKLDEEKKVLRRSYLSTPTIDKIDSMCCTLAAAARRLFSPMLSNLVSMSFNLFFSLSPRPNVIKTFDGPFLQLFVIRGRIFSRVRPFYEQAVSDLDP